MIIVKIIFFIIILNVSVAEASLASYEDHANDSRVTTEAANRPLVSKVNSKEVVYGKTGERQHNGYLSQPDNGSPKSALIVIHEWWGLNEDIHLMTDQLAALGYTALAVDLYDGQSAEGVREAFQLSTNLSKNETQALANLKEAYDYLEKDVGAEKIGIIGWCLGGKWSLRGALMLPQEIDATVIYYGSLVNDKEKLAALEMPIIGFIGTKDRLYDQFVEFDKNLKELDKDAAIHVYEGAKHAFANASGIAYEEKAAEDSWKKTVDFLFKHLK